MHLKNTFNFCCQCEICRLTGQELEKDENLRNQVENLYQDFLARGLAGVKEVNDFISKIVECGGVGINEITANILDRVFKEACRAAIRVRTSNSPLTFLQDLSCRGYLKVKKSSR